MTPDPAVLPEKLLGEESERRLWFDYISKLNDRRLQETSSSGATSWVLLGVETAILYRCVPRFGNFIAIPGALVAAAILLVLEADAVMISVFGMGCLLSYSNQSGRKRLLPKTSERVRGLFSWITLGVFLSLSTIQLFLAFTFGGPAFVKWTLVLVALVWAGGVATKAYQDLSVILKKRRLGVVIPDLSFAKTPEPSEMPSSSFFFVAVLFVLSVGSMFTYLHYLNGSPAGRLIPLSAATYALVFLTIGDILFVRVLGDSSRMAYYDLERSILVDNLTPNEIKNRFITELLGRELGEWVKSFTEKLEAKVLSFRAAIDSIDKRAREVEAIDTALVYERRGRAAKLDQELSSVFKNFDSSLDEFMLNLDEYLKVPVSGSEMESNQRTMDWLRSRVNGVKEHSAAAKALVVRLAKLENDDSPRKE
jgi:hypothetical protein